MFNKKEYFIEYYRNNKEILKERSRKWYYDNKDKALKRLKISNRKWQDNNRKKCRLYSKNYTNRYPWVKVYRYIMTRVTTNPFYIKKNIKMSITVTELKSLWIRDRAHLLKRPSIDRINRKKGYSFKNCQFIELSDNLKRRFL